MTQALYNVMCWCRIPYFPVVHQSKTKHELSWSSQSPYFSIPWLALREERLRSLPSHLVWRKIPSVAVSNKGWCRTALSFLVCPSRGIPGRTLHRQCDTPWIAIKVSKVYDALLSNPSGLHSWMCIFPIWLKSVRMKRTTWNHGNSYFGSYY